MCAWGPGAETCAEQCLNISQASSSRSLASERTSWFEGVSSLASYGEATRPRLNSGKPQRIKSHVVREAVAQLECFPSKASAYRMVSVLGALGLENF